MFSNSYKLPNKLISIRVLRVLAFLKSDYRLVWFGNLLVTISVTQNRGFFEGAHLYVTIAIKRLISQWI